MDYWLNLFSGTTWDQFHEAGAKVSGFRHRMRKTVEKVRPGDVLLCYMTGVMRWVGAVEVVGPSDDARPIWGGDFPCRLAVRSVIALTPETGVPMEQLEGSVSFFEGPADRGKFKGVVRRSPNLLTREDGEAIMSLLRAAEQTPVSRPVDPAKLARKPMFKAETKRGRKAYPTLVSIPEREEAEGIAAIDAPPEPVGETETEHTRIQHLLLRLGAEMGFDVWVARNDRSRSCGGQALGAMSGMVRELPTQFNEATNRTIELIDVLWLRGNSIVAAFEVECTTAIYSGLLRMSDLMALQPNLNIKLYIVAPDERRAKVEQEILRPTFKLRQKPLCEICGFLSTTELSEKIRGARELGLVSSLKPEVMDELADYFTEEESA